MIVLVYSRRSLYKRTQTYNAVQTLQGATPTKIWAY